MHIVKFNEIELKQIKNKWKIKIKTATKKWKQENIAEPHDCNYTTSKLYFSIYYILWGSVTLHISFHFIFIISNDSLEHLRFQWINPKATNTFTLKVHRFLLCHVTFNVNDDDDGDDVYTMVWYDFIHISAFIYRYRCQLIMCILPSMLNIPNSISFPMFISTDSLALSIYSSLSNTWTHSGIPFPSHDF